MMKYLGTTALALVVATGLSFAQGTGTSGGAAPSGGSSVGTPPAGTSGSGASGTTPSPTSPSTTQGTNPATNMPATGRPATPGAAGTTQGATTSGSGTVGTGGTVSGSYLSEQTANHWLASHYMGKTVYGPNNERVGDINDIVIDRTGTTTAIIVGVGGFLGMGEKNVAVPFSAIQLNQRDGRDELHMNVTKGDLETAPAFKVNRNRS